MNSINQRRRTNISNLQCIRQYPMSNNHPIVKSTNAYLQGDAKKKGASFKNGLLGL